jgi:cytosine/adenosine deaminase-related metal-dependent hydrolase
VTAGRPPALTVHNALLIPVADTGAEWFHGWLTAGADGRITAIGPGTPPALEGELLDAGGAMVAPGFVSAHSHLFTSGLRGIAPGSTLYPWVRAMMEVFAHADAEDLYWCTLHGALDFLANGVTSAYNFTQSRVTWFYNPATASNEPAAVHPPSYLTRQFDGAADAGIRVMNAIRLDDEAMDEDETLGMFDDMVAASADCVPADRHLGASVFGAVQWAAGPRTAQLEALCMQRHGLIDQAHFVETAQGVEVQRAKFAWYVDAGALGPRFLFGHFVHPTPQMVATAAAAGAGMVWQPTSNGRLGSGFADVIGLRAAGMRIGIGLDDQSCTDISDPFANMRMGLYTTRAMHTDAAVLMPRDVLRMHTLGAAEVLGVADRVGSLEVGKFADFLVVDHRSPSTGPVWDVLATYVLACGLRNLRRVYVGGRLASVDGRCTSPLAADADGELRERITRAAAAAGVQPAL